MPRKRYVPGYLRGGPLRRAYGGLMGLQQGGLYQRLLRRLRGPGPTEDTTRALLEFAERGGSSEEEKNRLFLSEGYEAPPEEHERFLRSIGAPERSIPSILSRKRWEGRAHHGEDPSTIISDFVTRQRLEGRASGGLMGLATGGPAPGQSQVTNFGVPQQTEQQWANLTDRIATEGQRGYQGFAGQRIAGVDPATRAAQMAQEQWAMGGLPAGVGQAGATLGQAGQMIQQGAQGVQALQGQQQDVAGQLGAGATAAQQAAAASAAGMQDLGAAARAEQQGMGAAAAAQGAVQSARTTSSIHTVSAPELVLLSLLYCQRSVCVPPISG